MGDQLTAHYRCALVRWETLCSTQGNPIPTSTSAGLQHGPAVDVRGLHAQKISGRELKYTALVGKPSELTYHHADYLLYQQALKMGIKGIHTIYCVGDNPESDIYGANLYNKYLEKRVQQRVKKPVHQVVGSHAPEYDSDSEFESDLPDELSGVYAKSCQSILVCTGVYCSSRDYVTYGRPRSSNHNHRDFVLDPVLTQPMYVTQNVYEAVKLVFEKEKVVLPSS
ncbi:hypothetical protein DPMN_005051 [Dreissena polymorpha]|uniref:Uncharacterized protein n=1 Tax=Dreissena polymorpha TaxID=45954 RepID=A0A9D4RW70_DREPO|nr:hypothetical protein DPMN_005051 [Dreissena polymorpha]